MEILTENELLSAVENRTFIENGRKESCEGIKYDFTLSKMALTVERGRPRDIEQTTENADIKPGEIAFVMTEESLNLPGNIYCQLSTKRKLSLDGIIILGELIIAPNYKGKLLFGLYNLSSRDYPLLTGKKLVAGVFYKLDKKSDKIPEPINDFPADLIRAVIDTKPNSISAVITTISNIKKALDELRTEMQEIKKNLNRDTQWETDFQGKWINITDLVMKIGEKLDSEIEARRKENTDLKNESLELRSEHIKLKDMVMPLSKMEKRSQFIKGSLITLAITVVAGVIVFLITYFIK
ncbi:MAG: hypothetical protein LBI28_03650 [Treponema sp.]|jgi:dUTPase|nr:hypothetical protein [Treponema sp.]